MRQPGRITEFLRVIRPSHFLLLLSISTLAAQEPRSLWQTAVDPSLSLEWEVLRRGGQPRLSAAERIHPGRRVVVRLAGPGYAAPEGLRLIARSGEVATAILDLDRLPEIASSPAVLFIQPERRVKPLDNPGSDFGPCGACTIQAGSHR